jgi:hypothetical protein
MLSWKGVGVLRVVFRWLGIFTCVCAICCGLAATVFALPAERRYEMVSPPFKGGFEARVIEGVATNGESVAFYSSGAFANAPSSGLSGTGVGYLAKRGASEWTTTPIMAPTSLIAEPQSGDLEPSLSRVFEMGKPGASKFNSAIEQNLLLHSTILPDIESAWEPGEVVRPSQVNTASFHPEYKSASVGFCHILLTASNSEPILPEAEGASTELYEVNRGCNGEAGSLALVGLDNTNKLIDPGCRATVGAEEYVSGSSAFNAVSVDGGEVFFTVCTRSINEYGLEDPHQLFVRLGGERTIEVSRPLGSGCVEVPCVGAEERASADFEGASEDGSKVYFTTSAPLVEGDKDTGNDLYMATIGCPSVEPACGVADREVTSLTQVSHDPVSGEAANTMGVVRVAPDGTRAYFVAGGDLLSQAEQTVLASEGRPLPQVGAANLYEYDSLSGSVEFVGDLCSGTETSGAAQDIHCPSAGSDASLWNDVEGEAQTGGPDGRFLVFSSYAQLAGGDTNVARDVYRFDSVTGQLDRVSGGEGGFDSDGNRTVYSKEGEVLGAGIAPGHYGGFLREQYEMNNRAISEDGSRIAFESAEPLSPLASNGLENVYEWQAGAGDGEGSVSLISSGVSEEPVEHAVISSSGNDLFFATSQSLVPQDIDGADDVYDARVGGGFPVTPAPVQPCSGDACQGPLTNPAPLLVPGSVVQTPGNNFPAPAVGKVKAKAKPKPAVCRKGFVKSKGKCVRHRAKKRSSGRGGK